MKTKKGNIKFQVGDLIRHDNDAFGKDAIYLVVASDNKCITLEYFDSGIWQKMSYSIAEASSHIKREIWKHHPVK